MNIAIILSGGVGSRFGGDIPKQYVDLGGQMVIIRSMRPFANLQYVNNIIIVADESGQERIEEALLKEPQISEKILGYASPGKNRQLSIYNGLKYIEELGLKDAVENVIIHDAARPFVSEKMIEECFEALNDHDGVMPVLPMNDTVYFSRTGTRVDELLNRNTIFAGQAPEAFNYKLYLKANEALLPDKILEIKGSTEPAILYGMNIAMIKGNPGNFKITTTEDFELAKQRIL